MNPYRIESIYLAQVGPFEMLDLKLPFSQKEGLAEIHILTGENGTGKTSVLEVVGSVFMEFYSDGDYKFQKIRYEESTVAVFFATGQTLTVFNKNHSPIKNKSEDYNIFYSFTGGKWRPEDQARLIPRFAAFAYSGYRYSEYDIIQGAKDIDEYPFKNATSLAKSIDSQAFSQWLVNTQTREFIARGKNRVNESIQYRKNLTLIETAISEITGHPVYFELEDNPFGAKINVDNQSLNFDQIPDGLKSIVSWLGDLLMRMDRTKWINDVPVLERPFLLLLDEIDVHLHPAWQRKILPVVQKLFPNAQVIVSTHSPFVVGSVDGAWVHRFVKKDGFSVLAGPPILSEDALSYEYILEEIFGIKERFGIEVEADLAEFQWLKKQALTQDEAFDELRFQELIQSLGSQSIELESLVGMELKQLQRLTQRSFI